MERTGNSNDNTQKMKEMIEETQERMSSSQNYIENNDVDGQQKKRMETKNEHRAESIENWREEIQEETGSR